MSAHRRRRLPVGWVSLVAVALGVAATGVVVQLPASADVHALVGAEGPLEAAFGGGGTVELIAPITINDGSDLVAPSGGSVTLDLHGHALTIGSVQTGEAGIEVDTGSSLTIEDTSGGGALTVTGGAFGAGIGGGTGASGGSVTVTSGSVTATGGAGGAGIGGGYGDGNTVIGGSGGSVTVSGGSVTATAGSGAAGIGGGYGGGRGGSVAVDAGSVTVGIGRDGANAIGGGDDEYAASNIFEFGTLSNAGTLTVAPGSTLLVPAGKTVSNTGTILGSVTNNGTITGNDYFLVYNNANGGSGVPGPQLVYAATAKDAGLSVVAPSTLPAGATFLGWFNGATQVTDTTPLGVAATVGPVSVQLEAHYGVTVGTEADLETDFGIDGETITLAGPITMDDAQYLVAPSHGSVVLDLAGQSLSISNVTAGGAAIDVEPDSSLTIEDTKGGGTLTVTGGSSGAGIGGRVYRAGGSVTVTGGSVTATGGPFGAGIGGGYGYGGGSVTVTGGSVTATGGNAAAGIGGGYNGSGGAVTVSAGARVTVAATDVPAIGAGFEGSGFGSLSNAGSLTVASGSTLVVPSGTTVSNTGSILGSVTNDGTITGHDYGLTFDANGGSGAPAAQTVYAATVKDVGLSLGAPTPPSWSLFTGWSDGATPVTDTTDLAATFGSATSGAVAVPLTAQYTSTAAFGADSPGVLGDVGRPYSYRYAATPAAGGATPVFAVASGSLPPGLLLDPTSGVLSGTPTTGGTYTFTVKTGDSVLDAVTPSTSITVEVPGATFIDDSSGGVGSVVSVPAGGGTPVPLAVSGLVTPSSMTVDAQGDLFIADGGAARVVKVPADGSAQTTVGTGFSDPGGVAVDAAGDVFVTDSFTDPNAIGPSPGDGKVVEVPVGGGAQFTVPGTTTLFDPAGLSVDAAGDLFIADNDDNRAVELPAGSSTLRVISSDVTAPGAAQVDAAGDVFISDNQGSDPNLQGQVVELPAGSGSQKPVGPQLGQADGLAEDAAGNLIVADAVNGDVVKIAPDGSNSQVASGFSFATGVAVFAPAPSLVNDSPSTSGTVGVAYPQYTFTASSPAAEPNATFRVAVGALPPGLTLDSVTGVLSGQPTQSGPFTFQVEAGNAATGVLSPSTTITVAPAAAASDVLQVSVHADRSLPVNVAGSSLSGSVYVFAAVPPSDRSVVFSLDGRVFHTEGGAPFDFNGTGAFTGSASVAYPFATGSLADGSHSISVVVTDASGKVSTASSSFTVANGAAAPPAVLQVSTHADRSSSVNLDGSTVKGNVYVFAGVPASDRSVVFSLDGKPFHTESGAPFDFNGTGAFTGSSSVALPFATSSLVDGTHTIAETAVSSMGVATSSSASFTVTNGTTAPPPASVPLRVSTNADRSGAFNLTGSTLTGTVYVFDVPTVPITQVVSVQFSLDGKVFHTEMGTPFDFNGTADAVNALPYSLNGLSKTKHTITALVTFTNGKTETDTATFTVT